MQHWHGKWHKAHQNQQEPSHWLKSSWVWPPLSVWVNLASSRTGSQNSFSHFVLAKVSFRVGKGNFPLWFLPLRYSHTWGSSWGSKCELWLSQGTHTHRDIWVFCNKGWNWDQNATFLVTKLHPLTETWEMSEDKFINSFIGVQGCLSPFSYCWWDFQG